MWNRPETPVFFLTKTTVYHGWKFSVSRRNSVMAVLSGTIPVIRAELLRKVLGYNRGVGGLAVGLQSRLALGLWLVKYWAVHKECKQTLPAFNWFNRLRLCIVNWCQNKLVPYHCLPGPDNAKQGPVYNKASLVAIMVIAVGLVSGGRTTWRTEACCQKSWMCWMQFSEGYWIICLH